MRKGVHFVVAALLLASTDVEPAQDGAPGAIVSVLTIAKDEAENAATEDVRIALRTRVAWSIQATKREAAFGAYVSDALAAWQARERLRNPNFEQLEKNGELYQQAKQALLAGESEKSKDLLRQCKIVTHAYDCLPDKDHFYDWRFLLWEIEVGNLSAALHRLDTTVWNNMDVKIAMAEHVANAYVASGRRQEAIDLLLRFQSAQVGAKRSLGMALWKVGAAEHARGAFREGVAAELSAAEADEKESLPVDLARIQLVMSDREGALETLTRIRALAAPLEYDPNALLGPHPRSTTITIKGDRWREARDKMAGVLAAAGLDSEAFALMHEPAADQIGILRGIMWGQAARGDFDAAFQTLERLRSGPLTVPETPLTIMPDPDRPNAYEIRTRTFESGLDALPLLRTILGLAKVAAHQGRADSIEKAFSLFRGVNVRIRSDAEWIEILKEHARAGQAASALSLARRLDSPSTRVAALAAVAEGMAGLRSAFAFDPLQPQG